jgi:hypothetical protein
MLILVGALFTLIGIGIALSSEVLPRRKWEASRKWTSTTCTILESSLKINKGEDSESYSIIVRYRYPLVEVADKNHEKSMTGDRYDLLERFDTSSDREPLQQLVAELPPGKTLPCYYDPDDANQVALYRDGYDFGPLTLFSHLSFAGFGLLFILLGWKGLRSLANQ